MIHDQTRRDHHPPAKGAAKAAVVRLTTGQRTEAESKPRPQKRRRNFLKLSFILLVIVPIAAVSYFWLEMRRIVMCPVPVLPCEAWSRVAALTFSVG